MLAAALFGVCVPVAVCVCPVPPSSEEGSGVVGLLFCELKFGRSRDVNDGDGGSGVGGLP